MVFAPADKVQVTQHAGTERNLPWYLLSQTPNDITLPSASLYLIPPGMQVARIINSLTVKSPAAPEQQGIHIEHTMSVTAAAMWTEAAMRVCGAVCLTSLPIRAVV